MQLTLQYHHSNKMLFLVIIVLAKLVTSQEILGIKYSFDHDFEKDFNSQNCGDTPSWNPVTYTAIDVTPYNSGNTEGIKATMKSCTNSFPIALLKNGELEIIVYTKLESDNSGITTILSNDDNEPLTTFVYNKGKDIYQEGWMKLSIEMEHDGIKHITLIGYSDVNEIVLIDSIEYKPYNDKKFEAEETELIFEQGNGIDGFSYVGHGNIKLLEDELEEGSGSEGTASEDGDGDGGGAAIHAISTSAIILVVISLLRAL